LGLYPSTNLAWVTLPGAVAPASIAVRVTETHKLLRHGKAAVQEAASQCFQNVTVVNFRTSLSFCSSVTMGGNHLLKKKMGGNSFKIVVSVIMTITNFWVWLWPLQYCCVWKRTN